eukprot:6079393-Alexandrium_andersonii.AAC.1
MGAGGAWRSPEAKVGALERLEEEVAACFSKAGGARVRKHARAVLERHDVKLLIGFRLEISVQAETRKG